MAVERWTDKMLDGLASSISDVKDSIDGLRATAQALLQVAAQNQRDVGLIKEEMELMKQRQKEEMELMKQRQAENDQRFYTLLEEVRYLNRCDRPEET
jgi:hypothetical protein